MRTTSPRRPVAAAVAVAAVTLGLTSPALAEGHARSYLTDWGNGHTSRTWTDLNLDGTDTHVTFAHGCTREFTATIRRERFGPDADMGHEHIDCGSYDDAVRAGDVPAGDYHFDVSGMTGTSCGKLSCSEPVTSVSRVDMYW